MTKGHGIWIRIKQTIMSWSNKVSTQLHHQSMKASLHCSKNVQSCEPTHLLYESLHKYKLGNTLWTSVNIYFGTAEKKKGTKSKTKLEFGKELSPFSLYKILFPRRNRSCGHSLTLSAYAKSFSILMSILTVYSDESIDIKYSEYTSDFFTTE